MMKLTKKLEADVLKFYKTYWDCYLNGDMKTLASMLDDNVKVFGTAVSEVFNNKKETIRFYKNTAEQLTGKAQFRNRQIDLSIVGDTILINEKCDFYFLLEKKWTYYGNVRVTAVLKQTNTGFKLVQQHASFPDVRADEGEQVAAEKIKEENLQLRDAVKRRTIELEEKNQELEIESALERVRSVAMSMRSSNELVKVCKVMNEELIKLGLNNIRNSQIAINNDAKQLYVNYEYSAYDGESITDIAYNSHRLVKAMVKKMKGSKDAFFALKITGKELNEWRHFRIKIGQRKDIKLAKAKAVCYYFYSVGNGALGISTFDTISKEQFLQLQRFRNVFVLAYKRFTDIQKAEAQTREAQIEIAVERVRAKALAMHRSEEISDVANVLRNELESLNIPGIAAATITLRQKEGKIRLWDITSVVELKEGFHFAMDFIFDLEGTKPHDWIRRIWDSKEKYFVYKQDKKDFKRTLEWTTEYDPEFAKNARKFIETNKIKNTWHPVVPLSHGKLSLDLLQEPVTEVESILTKMAAAFDLAYKRFLDLKNAEAQARETQIEAALERVRARAMAMHHSDELAELVATVFKELTQLGFKLTSSIIWINDHENASNTLWIASAEMNKPAMPYLVKPFHKDFFRSVIHAWKGKDQKWFYKLTGKEKKNFERSFFKELPGLPNALQKALKDPEQVVFSASFNNFGALEIVETEPLTEEKFQILHRFGKVFDLSYTRFNDLQNAEAQAREAQIEASLERVRARTMGMHSSSELSAVIKEVTDQLQLLGFDFDTSNIGSQYSKKGFYLWNSVPGENDLAGVFVTKADLKVIDWFYGNKDLINKTKATIFNKNETTAFFKYYLSLNSTKQIPAGRKKFLLSTSSISLLTEYRKDFTLSVLNYRGVEYSNEESKILTRFANVFEQTYTRFLDLQKAELQARDAEIELALERVRARTMAMHSSIELIDVIGLLQKELTHLEFALNNCIFWIMNEEPASATWWVAPVKDTALPESYEVAFPSLQYFNAVFKAWKQREHVWTYELTGTDKKRTDSYIFNNTGLARIPKKVKEAFIRSKKVYISISFYDYGGLHISTPGPLSEDQLDIINRFSKVFNQTYTRFLDLQKAEAQAREAEIELALERVRAKTMAMQKPSEFADVVNVIGEQFIHLGFDIEWANFGGNGLDIAEGIDTWNFAVIPGGKPISSRLFIPRFDHPVFIDAAKELNNYRRTGNDLFVMSYNKKEKDRWLDHLFTKTIFKEVTEEYRAIQYAKNGYTTSNLALKNTFLSIGKFDTRSFTDEQHAILRRIGKAFGQAYTRFLDLQKAEEQAKEAQIEAALERVRAKAMAMHSSAGLSEVVHELRKQMGLLGQKDLETCVIHLHDESPEFIHAWAAIKPPETNDEILEATANIPKKGLSIIEEAMYAYSMNRKDYIIINEGEKLKQWFSFLKKESPVGYKKLVESVKGRIEDLHAYWSFADFAGGALLVVTMHQPDNITRSLLRRFSNVFGLAYRRFADLKQAEAQAREAQIQLSLERVRARAMAMYHSDELSEVLSTLFEQFDVLGINPSHAILSLVDLEKNTVIFRLTGKAGKRVSAQQVIDLNAMAIWKEIVERWKKDGPDVINLIHYPKEVLPELWKIFREVISAIPEEARIKVEDFPDGMYNTEAYCQFGYIGFCHTRFATDEEKSILVRFATEFGRLYQRFLDLQKAEAQAREAQIEASMEKVRSRSLAMQKPEELIEVAELLRKEMGHLGVEELETSSIYIVDKENKKAECWYAIKDIREENTKLVSDEMSLSLADTWVGKEMWKFYRSANDHVSILMKGERRREWINYCAEQSKVLKGYYGNEIPERTYHLVKFNGGYMGAASPGDISKESWDLLKRAAAVFSFAYTRFKDLQDAAARAREAQIELALERVRARTIGMQKSEELKEVIQIVYEQFVYLDIHTEHAGFVMDYKTRDDYYIWIADKFGSPSQITLPYFDCIYYNRFNEAKKKGIGFFATTLDLDEKNKFYEDLFKHIPGFPEGSKKIIFSHPGFTISTVLLENVALYIENFTGVPYTDDENNILIRFGKVFQQTYTRFVDLQKAEAQARESQIQLALERVRARTMAMQKSDELSETSYVLFQQFKELGEGGDQISIGIFDEDEKAMKLYATFQGSQWNRPARIEFNKHRVYQNVYKGWKEQKRSVITELTGKELQELNKIKLDNPDYQVSENELAKDHWVVCTAFFSNGVLSYASHETPSKESIELLERFASVFDLTYRRFLDLQNAEAQARESQIQLALERVRARTMAMQKSDELPETAYILFQQFKELGEEPVQITIGIFNEQERKIEFSITGLDDSGSKIDQSYKMDIDEPILMSGIYKAWKDQKTSTVFELSGKELSDWITYRNKLGGLPQSATPINYESLRSVCAGFFSKGFISFSRTGSISQETISILERFAGVFDLTYTRFLDLQKAESQAKEAQIQLALERVRARTMAMQKSDELPQAANLLFQQIQSLGMPAWSAGYCIWDDDNKKSLTAWMSSEGVLQPPFKVPTTEEELFIEMRKGAEQGKVLHVVEMGGEKLVAHYKYMRTLPVVSNMLDSIIEAGFPLPTFQIMHQAYFSKGFLLFITYEPVPEAHDIFKRFSNVFDQTYTRFLDLQKAEAQAKEAHIETALERVRSRSMAMHQTSELQDVIHTVHKELLNLKLSIDGGSFVVINDDVGTELLCWGSGGTADTSEEIQVPHFNMPFCTNLVKGIKNGQGFFTEEFSQKEKKEYFTKLFEQKPWSDLSNDQKNEILSSKGGYTRSVAVSKHTSIFIINHHGIKFTDEENDILKRFAKVFDQTYTRFLDLKKAEGQAKEAKIEAALERVRAASMAMHDTKELVNVATVLYNQLLSLGFDNVVSGGFNFPDEASNLQKCWLAESGDMMQDFAIKLSGDWVLDERIENRKKNIPFFEQILRGKQVREHLDFLFPPEFESSEVRASKDAMPVPTVFAIRYLKEGYMILICNAVLSEEQKSIVDRFAAVFNLAYTRFLDLKKAEEQARESQIQLALERVRARTMAMHRSEELAETAQVMFHQLQELGVIPDRISIGVVDEVKAVVNFWSTDQSGSHINNSFSARLNERTVIEKTYKAWKDNKRSLIIELHGDELKEWIHFASEEMRIHVDKTQIKDRRVHTLAFFSHGWILVTTHEPQSQEAIQILERFASVFNLTYRRFLDLEKAEAQVREAQIEAALEKVRSRSLAMHKSDELQEVVNTVFERLTELNVEMDSCNIAIFKEGTRDFEFWIASPFQKKTASFRISGDWDFPIIQHLLAGRESGKYFFSECFSIEDKNKWFQFAFENTDFRNIPPDRQKFILEQKAYALSIAFSKHTGLQINRYSGNLPTESEIDVLKRFSKVFEQAYIRFLDLEKAEAQAREAQIEAGLERVRAKTMAMHKSDEVTSIAVSLNEELLKLGFTGAGGSTIIIINDKTGDTEQWTGFSEDKTLRSCFVPYFKHPFHDQLLESWKKGESFFAYTLQGDEKKSLDDHYFNTGYNIFPENDKKWMRAMESVTFSHAFMKYGAIHWAPDHVTEEQAKILQRFAKVFEQSYTRFLDLQKAEAQAREAQIEIGLERVRSRAMAMQSSDELKVLIGTMFTELTKLDLVLTRCIIWVFTPGTNDARWWMANSEDPSNPVSFFIQNHDHPAYNAFVKAWKDQTNKFIYDLKGNDKLGWDEILFNQTELKNLPGFIKDGMRAPERVILSGSFNNFGGINAASTESLSEEHFDILLRFAKVFDLTYTRFLDLKKAEAQARESQIEAALERVRSKAMAMHKTEDLNPAVAVVFDELEKLDIGVLRCGISILNREKRTGDIWVTSTNDKGSRVQVSGDEAFDTHPLLQGAFEAWLRQEDFSYMLEGEDLSNYYNAVKQANFILPESQRTTSKTSFDRQYCYTAVYQAGGLFAFRNDEFSDEGKKVMKRFANVFDLTYKRFLDLQNAEAQAREAQIEAGLERVRARTMAMHSSNDVSIATATMFTELEKLGIQNLRGGITIIRPDQTQEVWSVTNLPDGRVIRAIGVFDMRLHPLWRNLYEGKERKEDYQYYWMAGQDKQDYINILNTTPDYLIQPIKDFPDIHVQSYFFGEGAVWTNSLQPHSEEDKQIMKRFAGVFGQTYRRYLDLQKAEASARESQIETALEKVRASTMAMQKSEDLSQAAFVLFKQFKELGESPERIFIATFDNAEETVVDLWGTNQGGNQLNRLFRVSADEPTVIKKIVNGWKEKKSSIVIDLTGDELKNYLQFLENTGIPVTPGVMTERRVQTVACFSKGVIGVTTPEPRPAASIQLLERFANVFDLTYTRFLDLLQAEAQAREATIEAALERVRGKAMAMHSSKDLAATIGVFYHELEGLSLTPRRCGVGLINKEARTGELSTMSTTSEGQTIELIGTLDLTTHPVLEGVYNNWYTRTEYHPVLRGNEIKEYYQAIRPQIAFPDYPDDTVQYGYFFFFDEGGVYAWTEKELQEDELKIYRRFTSVLSLTYKRYKDLKDAEARAQNAIKEAALDRIRADIASMRTIEDLDRITPLIWNELTILNIPFIRCGVFIMDETQELIHTFLSTPDGKAIAAFHLPYKTPGNIQHVLSHWRNKNKYIDHWNEEEFHQFAQILVQQGALDSAENYLKTIPHGGFYLHFLPFLQGMLYVGNTTKLNDEMVVLVQAIADAFSTAYARYEDFNRLEIAKKQVENTLTDLKQAQQQLVQSEKMASLGELTAGIAHEIQNPLNFVNNFSDVSNELLEEMKNELEKGNKDDAIAIVEDIKQNLEKILHHGKRADAIVKGMLQHSRVGSGQKEMTDINSLADEYLRLAYHGLRAKDKTFNAKFETHFDDSIGKVHMIPQDIGRVLLNLINNAFYTVTEKKKKNDNGYEPTVTVTTLKDNGRIEIKVKDNGNGISQKNLDKIFQPFFTTKPTGQGTGLGLSLAYDIVTKGHGGELKVETKEGEGSEFIIQLPAN